MQSVQLSAVVRKTGRRSDEVAVIDSIMIQPPEYLLVERRVAFSSAKDATNDSAAADDTTHGICDQCTPTNVKSARGYGSGVCSRSPLREQKHWEARAFLRHGWFSVG